MHTHWCFTLNNPTGHIDWENLRYVRYAIYSEEIGDNGNYHFQGYIECRRQVRLSYFRKELPGAHLEPRHGTRDQARAYCMKQDETYISGPYEYGVWNQKGQGHRKDIKVFVDQVKLGMFDKGLVEACPVEFVKYYKAADRIRQAFTNPRVLDKKCEVIVYYGPTETNKSRTIMETYGIDGVYWKNDTKWWDGYSGEKTVVWQEFDGKSISVAYFNQMCDRYPFKVETKGGTMELQADTIVFSTNYDPAFWYNSNVSAVMRRITKLFVYNEDTKSYVVNGSIE